MDSRDGAKGYVHGHTADAVVGSEYHGFRLPRQDQVFETLSNDACDFQVSEDFEFVETHCDGHETSNVISTLPSLEQSARLDFDSTFCDRTVTTPMQQHSAAEHLRRRLLNAPAFKGQTDSQPRQLFITSPATRDCLQPDVFLTLEELDWEPPCTIIPGQEQSTASDLVPQNQASCMHLETTGDYQLFDPDMTHQPSYLGPEQQTEWSLLMQGISSNTHVQATTSHQSPYSDKIHESANPGTEQHIEWTQPQPNVGSKNSFYDASGHQPSRPELNRGTVHLDENRYTRRKIAQQDAGLVIQFNAANSHQSSELDRICRSTLSSPEQGVEQSPQSDNATSLSRLNAQRTYRTPSLDISPRLSHLNLPTTSVLDRSTIQDNFFGSASPSTVNAHTTWSGLIATDQLLIMFENPTVYGKIPLGPNSQNTLDFYENLLVNTRGKTLRPLIHQRGMDFSQQFPCQGYVKGLTKRIMAIPLRRVIDEIPEPAPPCWLVKIMIWPETELINPFIPQVHRSEDQSDKSNLVITSMEHHRNVTFKVQALHSIDDGVIDETFGNFEYRLIKAFKQMMYVSGETVEPSTETTWMIEEIVREQVVEMLKEASALANRRGSKSISIVDLIFQIRQNPAKVSRLKTFLSWKDVRKNVKDSDDKAGGADDALDLEEGALPGANPAAPQKTQTNKKAKLILPWEVQSYFSEQVPEREDEEDEEEEEQNEATLARLASADERTKNMTREEYVYWSECRQASFTFRKGKRFREWAGFGTIIDSKPNDDVVDILGFLTFEIVQTLTEEALRVKNAEDLANKKAGGGDVEASKKRKREGCTLFAMPREERTPVEPKHVQEAFRRLQIVPNKYKFMRQGLAGTRTPLRMI